MGNELFDDGCNIERAKVAYRVHLDDNWVNV